MGKHKKEWDTYAHQQLLKEKQAKKMCKEKEKVMKQDTTSETETSIDLNSYKLNLKDDEYEEQDVVLGEYFNKWEFDENEDESCQNR